MRRVELKEPSQYGEWLRFRVEIRTDTGALDLEIAGNGIRKGRLYGPATFAKGGRAVPMVTYHEGGFLRAAILAALAETTWRTDFPTIQFPPEVSA